MNDEANKIRSDALAAIDAARDAAALDAVRVAALGKKGSVTELMKSLGKLPVEQRKDAGAALNTLKTELSDAIDARAAALAGSALESRLATERVDVTLPTRPLPDGRIHPLSQTLDEIVAIFGEMGFAVAEGPDIEDDFHNFTALNIPPEHPARQSHDTFYMKSADGQAAKLLRTHTSPVQIRTMMSQKPPIRIIVPGRTFRVDYDATHSPNFHQVEGLVIDKTTHMGHLKGCLIEFVRAFLRRGRSAGALPGRVISRSPSLRPKSDIGCSRAGGELKIGAGGDWLEILGCGMVHPKGARQLRHRSQRVSGLRRSAWASSA